MARYVTVEDMQAYARDETATANYAHIEAALDAAEAELDNACQRRFEVAGVSATARVFVPASAELVRFHDCVAVSSIANRGTTVSAASYQLEPLNGLADSGEAWPYEQARLLSGLWDFGSSNDREATVTVTARWGWVAIPPQIVQACKVLAKDIISNRDVRFGLVAVTEAAGIGARTNPIVASAIASYARVESWGIG